MCGIAGYVRFGSAAQEIGPEILSRMMHVIQYRGPDDSSTYLDAYAALGHVRLSILDLASGRQPMHNEDKTLWITYNGEIFNYLELRDELCRKGHVFTTKSDAEVILHLFEEEGEECVHRLNGQWALAIWNSRRRRLFLSRDRLGVRPLFYAAVNGTFVFGSECKCILAFPAISRELDFRALDQVFTYWFRIPPRTIFKSVQELPPAHSMIIQNGQVRVVRYWSLDYEQSTQPTAEQAGLERTRADELLALLTDAIRLRMRSDVPVAALISGGLDSALTAALMTRLNGTPIKTFSVAFDDREFDESAYQNEVVRFLHSDHEEERCSYEAVGQAFPGVIWHAETPVLRTAAAPFYLLSKRLRDCGYKVAMTGEGADEIFGGYDIFKEAKIRHFWSRQPESKARPLLLRKLYPYQAHLQAQPEAYLRAFFRIGDGDDERFFSHTPRWELTSRLKAFYSDDLRSTLQHSGTRYADIESDLPRKYSRWHWFCQAQYLESAYFLPGYILSSQGDRVFMSHSVEARHPFLDYRVVEYASRLHPALKMKVLNEKYLLKMTAASIVPEAVRCRAKQPYRAPDIKSLLSAKPPEFVDELLSPKRLREDGVFRPAAVQKLAEKARRGRAIGVRDNMALVGILSTELLIHQFVRGFGQERAWPTA